MKKSEGISIIKMDCPMCGAPIAFGDNIDSVKCSHCGGEFLINDKATSINRIKRAESEAKRRDIETDLDAERRKNDEILRVEKARRITQIKIRAIAIGAFALVIIIAVIIGSVIIPYRKRHKGIKRAVYAPCRWSYCVGENYEAVERHFERAGFENIELVPEARKLFDSCEYGEVRSVSIDGNYEFIDGEQFPRDAEVIISYYLW